MKLIGYLGNEKITFTSSGNKYTCEIPSNLTGKYLIKLIAIDDAGNETVNNITHCTIDFDKFKFSFIEKEYNLKEKQIENNYIESLTRFNNKEINSEV